MEKPSFIFPMVAMATILLLFSGSLNAASPTAMEFMSNGVHEIAITGAPGPLCVFGREVETLVTGGQPGREKALVAAAPARKGRIVAFGHDGYFGRETLETADTAKWMENAILWAARTTTNTAKLRFGTLQDDRNAANLAVYLSRNGWNGKVLQRNKLDEELAYINVLCLDAGSLRTDDEIASIQRYLEHGGGCVAVSLGWGWLQLNSPHTIYEHPGNRLLGKYGICWADGACEPTTPNGYRVAGGSPYVNATNAIDELIEEDSPENEWDQETQSQISSTLAIAAQTVPLDSPWRKRLQTFEFARPIIPTPQAPITTQDIRARIQMTLELQRLAQTPDAQISAHPAGDVFPGKCGAATSESRTITIDPAQETGWKSLGLYAAPGAVVRVTTPENVANTNRFAVRIGCHTDNIAHLDSWQRYPQITKVVPITRTETVVANAFGGMVYVVVPETTRVTEPFTIQVTGATASPHYVAGDTTDDEWIEQLDVTTAPWGEIESNRVVLTLPTSVLKRIDPTTLEPLTSLWDRAMIACDRLASVQASNRKWRYVPDLQISAGYMHSGYPIMLPIGRDGRLANHLVELDTLTTFAADEVWGFFHEVGHNYQSTLWTTPGKGEVTCNWFALYVIETVCGVPDAFEKKVGNLERQKAMKLKYVENGRNFDVLMSDPFLYLLMDYQLKEAFGWDAFIKVTESYQNDMANDRVRLPKDAERIDQYMVRFSTVVGRNLAPFFDDWGVPIRDEARKQVDKLPAWNASF